jgi:hypothetical protein
MRVRSWASGGGYSSYSNVATGTTGAPPPAGPGRTDQPQRERAVLEPDRTAVDQQRLDPDRNLDRALHRALQELQRDRALPAVPLR